MMKFTHRILVPLLDKQWHRLGDIAGYILNPVDPARAVRTFRYGRKSNAPQPSLDYQVIKGKRRLLRITLWQMQEKNYIEVKGTVDNVMNDDWEIRLTDEGEKKLFSRSTDNKRSGGFGSVFRELKKLIEDGKATITVTLRDGAGTVGTEVNHEEA